VGTARAVRAKIQHIQSQTYIEVCQMYGYSKKHTIIKHVLPNLSDVLLSRFLLGVNSCILMEATLSFLGFGDLYYPTWGVMINFAWKKGALLVGAYQYALVPCICIMLVSLAFYFIALFVEGKQNTING
jgi:peptide/nickel transport system permease protein